MSNERNTEKFVRDHFNQYDKIIVEEQSSDVAIINSALKSASKNKTGSKGFPEFLISFKEDTSLIVVVECKAETSFHKSDEVAIDKNMIVNDSNKASTSIGRYAVDGVIHYMKHLNKNLNVIGIAVSGETKKELKIDTFLLLKGEKAIKNLDLQNFQDVESYIDILHEDDEKIKLDVAELKKYSRDLNNKLRNVFSFEENERPLVVSGILLALTNKSFCNSYGLKTAPKQVATLLVETIIEILENDNIRNSGLDKDKREIMKDTYKFIKNNTSIISPTNKKGKPNTELKDLIDEIKERVYPFLIRRKDYDIIGQFYIDFLKYANGDGGLGIVLTPPYITKLFTSLVEMNKNSVVMDNCCGTAGFLISSMNLLEDLAGNDRKKIKDIHQKQLIGIEESTKMFCLGCSNMMLKGDGKSNIIKSSCFDIEANSIRKKFSPTIAFLNPPYSNTAHKELEFIENALDFILPNGMCAAIIPVSCFIDGETRNTEIKERIMKNHTIKAVMSMPDELFYDSDKSIVTSIIVIQAHTPHKDKDVWFGYWKEDGLVKIRNSGRIDYDGRHEAIVKKWLEQYNNKMVEEMECLVTKIKPTDEWCFEYFEKINSKLDNESIYKAFKEYLKYKIDNNDMRLLKELNSLSVDVEIGARKKKEFQVKNFFNLDRGKRFAGKDRKKNRGDIPYISSTAKNNGVPRSTESGEPEKVNEISKNKLEHKGKFLSVVCYGEPMNTFYQNGEGFWISDSVNTLFPKLEKFNLYIGLYFKVLLEEYIPLFNYGRGATEERLKKLSLNVFVDDNGEIDLDYIEEYIKKAIADQYLKGE